eukprot:TRINITY_DN8404_c0_g1_i5.p1 TRINITY_DN8404_c0_g1~~TRINITY_DN8404_c0_g1_i5.p1  ORF type:complete len:269 (-),score=67.20 TRINITY_DN8404_c0_g1_i5:247-1053(-)
MKICKSLQEKLSIEKKTAQDAALALELNIRTQNGDMKDEYKKKTLIILRLIKNKVFDVSKFMKDQQLDFEVLKKLDEESDTGANREDGNKDDQQFDNEEEISPGPGGKGLMPAPSSSSTCASMIISHNPSNLAKEDSTACMAREKSDNVSTTANSLAPEQSSAETNSDNMMIREESFNQKIISQCIAARCNGHQKPPKKYNQHIYTHTHTPLNHIYEHNNTSSDIKTQKNPQKKNSCILLFNNFVCLFFFVCLFVCCPCKCYVVGSLA